MVYLTRVEHFNAAHRLWVKEWSEEKNFEIFGKCANKNSHGHNYKLVVTVKGIPDPLTGFVMNAKELGNIIKERITEVIDHTNLNLDENFLPDNIQPTSENLVIHIWKQLVPHLNNSTLHSVRLYETEKIYAEYFGE